tara:strand:- start:355 stop:861 length:507 start_codon:yes stop_codon:yes gene_type:complete
VKINVESIASGKIGEKFEHDFTYEMQSDINRVVKGKLFVMKTNYGFNVRANCFTNLKHTCGRCLESFESPLEFSFSERFSKENHPTSESTMKDDFRIEVDGNIDVSQAIEQYLIIETPFNTVCSNDCKGLCQQCGANLNQDECSCTPRLSNPAWENLRDLWENKTKPV